MPATVQNLNNLERGDSQVYNITVTKAGVAEDITGWKFYFTLREDLPTEDVKDDTGAILKKSWTVADGTLGKTSFELTHNNTKNLQARQFHYDIRVKKPDESVKSWLKGKIQIEATSTRIID